MPLLRLLALDGRVQRPTTGLDDKTPDMTKGGAVAALPSHSTRSRSGLKGCVGLIFFWVLLLPR